MQALLVSKQNDYKSHSQQTQISLDSLVLTSSPSTQEHFQNLFPSCQSCTLCVASQTGRFGESLTVITPPFYSSHFPQTTSLMQLCCAEVTSSHQ